MSTFPYKKTLFLFHKPHIQTPQVGEEETMVTGHFNWMCVGWREWERLQNWCWGLYINMAWFGEPTDSAEGE